MQLTEIQTVVSKIHRANHWCRLYFICSQKNLTNRTLCNRRSRGRYYCWCYYRYLSFYQFCITVPSRDTQNHIWELVTNNLMRETIRIVVYFFMCSTFLFLQFPLISITKEISDALLWLNGCMVTWLLWYRKFTSNYMYVHETWDKFTEFVLWKFEIFQVKWEKGIVKFEKKMNKDILSQIPQN